MLTSPTNLVILTGAGISADSGVDTYRDAGGLWEGHRFEDVATPEAWQRDRAMVWRFYQLRRAQIAAVQPNAAHAAIAKHQKALSAKGGKLTLVTQNVDDLHQRVGTETLAMHGELLRLRCERCGTAMHDRLHFDSETLIPCMECEHAAMRPDVVWFGEMPYHLEAIETALQEASAFMAVGTSGAVYPAAGLLAQARQAGIPTIVQGLAEPDNLHPLDRFVPGRASEVLPDLLRQLVSAS